jgi:hypothetical protein
MKTILFFDRCDLTRLYILLTKELQGKAKVIHVAFSELESKMLEKAGISDYIDYQKVLSYQVDTLKTSKKLLEEIDLFIITQSKGKFTFNGSIQSDRGYTLLTYEEAIKLACCHYSAWKSIFAKYHVDIMYHEPASMFMTHIAALLCKSQEGEFLYPTQLLSDSAGYSYLNIDGEDFTCKELEQKYNYYKDHPEEIDKERCKKYLEKFRSDFSVAFGGIVKPKSSLLDLYINSLKHKIIGIFRRNRYDKIKNNIDYWMLHSNRYSEKIFNLRQYKKRRIKFEYPHEGEKYFYYSIHLEPEATVLYLSGGKYTNQVKLIENIAASLPVGYYLYVKDHPHEFAYRKADDYERLLKVPNIRLIDQRVSGKALIAGAVGVFSIVGTAGFEGLLLGKQSYCFAKTYYSLTPKVSCISSIGDLQPEIYKNMHRDYCDDTELYTYLYAYLTSMHDGFVTYFGMDRIRNAGIDEENNARLLAANILR